MPHWVDELADRLEDELRRRGKKEYVFNGGLSVSGLQHIGRLRGEVILGEVLRRILEKRGFRIRQLLTLYTQDAWKGKKPQLEAFPDPGEAEKYRGWPLIRVPDPQGCHSNWVEHFWEDFGPYISEFTDGRIEIVTTTELYRNGLRGIVGEFIEKREEARRIVNKYRGRKPYPEGWIPFEAVCKRCGRIDSTRAVEVVENGVRYVCNSCGHEGTASFSEGKLNWRLEWAGVWKALGVDFEPYGKDHATPGGSRDSCAEISRKVLGYEPPAGQPYEWVALRTPDGRVADMTSSGFIGVTPREWLEVAHAEILRYLYLQTHIMRRIIIGMHEIPIYYSRYYKAMRLYYGLEEPRDEEDKNAARSFELAQLGEPPEKPLPEIPYIHAALLVQTVPGDRLVELGIEKLRRSGHLPETPSKDELNWAGSLLEKAARWVDKYAPDNLRIRILEDLEPGIVEALKYRDLLIGLGDRLEEVDEWREERIKEEMIKHTSHLSPGERREFYREFYRLFLGRDQGPRAAPLLAVLDKEFVVRRLRLEG